MSGLFSAANVASSSLQAQEQALEVMSENVANAATPGYHRQRAVLVDGTTIPSGTAQDPSYTVAGSGVSVAEIQQVQDQYLDNQVNVATGQSSYSQLRSSTLDEVESAFNEPTDSGLQSQLDSFWNAWSSLSANPGDSASQEGVISAANNLAQGITTIYSTIQQTSANLTSKLSDDVTQINTISSQIAQLNGQIDSAGTGDDINTLLDDRDSLVTQLTGLAGVSVSNPGSGEFTVTLDNKVLVQGTIADQLGVRTNADNGRPGSLLCQRRRRQKCRQR